MTNYNTNLHGPQAGTFKTQYAHWRAKVVQAFHDAGLSDQAVSFASCQSQPTIWTKTNYIPPSTCAYVCGEEPGHHIKLMHASCDMRTCPECAARESARLIHRYMPKIKELRTKNFKTLRLRHITLTTPYDLRAKDARQRYIEGFKQVSVLLNRCFGPSLYGGSKTWRKTHGAIVSAEFGPTGHKLHYHILAWCNWIPQETLSETWSDVTGGAASVVWISDVEEYANRKGVAWESAASEVLKYAVKFHKKDRNGRLVFVESGLIPKLEMVLKGTRRVRSYGVFYNLPEPPQRIAVCPECGSVLVRWTITDLDIWKKTGWQPDEAADSLNSKLANKSPPHGHKNKPPTPPTPPHQRELFGADTMTRLKPTHYDEI